MVRKFQPFEMERLMSKLENEVEYNLSESGVYPVTLRELLVNKEDQERLFNLEMNYPQANGIALLRERIAALYTGSGINNILVTVGAIEANYLIIETLLEPGDEIALMHPNYTQIYGLAINKGINMRPYYLRENNGWALDLSNAVTEKTKMIAVCNPNNPTGYILSENEMDMIVAAAEKCGAWILADEVYAGAERLVDSQTPSFWGRYDKVLAVGSLSKAYGLPGLRLGWCTGPEKIMDELWARHEYLAISATMPANHLAAFALRPDVRSRLIKRARGLIREGYKVFDHWISSMPHVYSVTPSQASAVAFVKYHFDMPSEEFIEKLIREQSVLVIPGAHFGVENHFRIAFGLDHNFLKEGLRRIDQCVSEISSQ